MKKDSTDSIAIESVRFGHSIRLNNQEFTFLSTQSKELAGIRMEYVKPWQLLTISFGSHVEHVSSANIAQMKEAK